MTNLKLIGLSAIAVWVIGSNTPLFADIPLTVDPSQSSLTIELLGDKDSSSLSGSGQIALVPPAEPFDTAQVTGLHVVMDDGFSLSVLGGAVQISADPGAVSLELLTPGAPGDVNQSNEFQQFGNSAELGGIIDVFDPFNLLFGTGPYDLAKLGPTPFDITDAQLSVSDNELTVTINFLVQQEISPGVFLTVTGTVVLNGQLPVCANLGTLVEGTGETGDFNSTCGSDDVRWAAHGATFAFQVADPVVQFELTATAPAGWSGTTLSVEVEASKENNNGTLNLRAKLFDFQSGSYVDLPGVMPLTTADTVQSFSLPVGSDPQDFVDPNKNSVTVLLQTIQSSGLPNVRTRLDEVVFRFE